jgi:hypothetical protein
LSCHFPTADRQQKTRRAWCIGGSVGAGRKARLSGRSHTCTITAAEAGFARFRSERFRAVKVNTGKTMAGLKG